MTSSIGPAEPTHQAAGASVNSSCSSPAGASPSGRCLAQFSVSELPLWEPEALWAQLEAILEGPRPADCAPLAVFDADETLWGCDVGEDLFSWFVREEKVHPSVAPQVCAFLDAHGIPSHGDARQGLLHFLEAYEKHSLPGLDQPEIQIKGYEFMVWCMAGHHSERLREWAAARIPELLPTRVYDAQRQLIERLEGRGIRCFVVSASSHWSVVPGASLMGVPSQQVCAVGLEQDGATTLPHLLRPAPIDTGKVDVIQRLTPLRPLFGFGDSRFDVPMLRHVHVPVLVNQKTSALTTASRFPGVPWRRVKHVPIGSRA